MNAIRQTQLLNKRELENATPPSASWHADYRDTAYVYVGGLHLDLTEGDVVTIFSQYGNPTHLNLIRDKETGKSKGFAFLKYEDQRSCDLAVDNLGGAEVLGRLLSVDHTRYKKRDDEDEDTYRIDRLEAKVEEETNGNGKRGSDDSDDGGAESRHKKKKRREMLKEEAELEEMLAIQQDGEEADPMREYLIREKREEVEKAKERDRERRERKKHKHHHHRRRDEEVDDGKSQRRHRHRDDGDRDGDKDAGDEGDRRRERRKERDEDEDEDERRPRKRDDRASHRDREEDGDRKRRHRHHGEDSKGKSSRERSSMQHED